MGIAGIVFSFYKCCCAKSSDEAEERVSATSYAGYRSSTYDCYFVYCGPYYNPAYGYYYGPCGNWSCDCCCCCDAGGCGDCNCGDSCSGGGGSGSGGDCKCDGGGEGSAVLLVIGLVILAVVILIGLFFGVFLFTLVASKIVHRRTLRIPFLLLAPRVFNVVSSLQTSTCSTDRTVPKSTTLPTWLIRLRPRSPLISTTIRPKMLCLFCQVATICTAQTRRPLKARLSAFK
jgi:hypothetical protein